MSSTADRRFARWIWGWCKSLAIAVAIWLALRTFVVQAFSIPSASMENTLLVGDFLFVTKTLYGTEVPFTHGHLPALREPRRGEIIVFRSVEGDFAVVKRLIGVPGDTVGMRHGLLVRNGRMLREPYAVHTDPSRSEDRVVRQEMRDWQLPHLAGPGRAAYRPDLQDWGPIVVPRGSLFVLGDNRDNSLDSRYWGFVPRTSLLGKPLFIYYSYDASSWRSLPFLSAIRWHRLLRRPD